MLLGLLLLCSWPAMVARRSWRKAGCFCLLARNLGLSAGGAAPPTSLSVHLLCLAVVVRGEVEVGRAGLLLISACLQGAMELLRRSPSVRNTRRSSSTARPLAGMAAHLQPPRWRPFFALFAGARRLSTAKWFVPGGGETAGGFAASPEVCHRAFQHRISTAASRDRRRTVVVAPRDPIAFSVFVSGCFM